MPIVMKLIGWANGMHLPIAGQYVGYVDVQYAYKDPRWLCAVPTQRDAKRWPDLAAAFAQWKEVLEADPVRPDGEPNRPMTALTVQMEYVRK